MPQLEYTRITSPIIDEDIMGSVRKVYLKEENKGSKKPKKKNRYTNTSDYCYYGYDNLELGLERLKRVAIQIS